MSWPVLAGDDLFGYQTGYLLGGGALLAGAWLGLRDRATGAADLVRSPRPPRGGCSGRGWPAWRR